MKNYKSITIILLAVIISMGSCKKFLKEELNDNPTALSYPEPSLLLPTAIANLAYYYGGDFARHSALLNQQVVGTGNQWAGYANYNYTDSDFDNPWNSLYGTTLQNLDEIATYANGEGMLHYEGLSKILMAFTYSILVDYWDEVPFSEALQGADNLQPKFDAGASVYAGCHTLIDEGIALLGQADVGQVPGSDDLLFAGDVQSWIDFGHQIKIRLYVHTKDYNLASGQIAQSNPVDAVVSFGGQSGPMAQFNSNRAGDITYIGSNLYNLMTAIGDERVYTYVDTALDELGAVFGAPSAPVWLLSSIERRYLAAEVYARTGQPTAMLNTIARADSLSFDYAGNPAGLAALNTAYPVNAADPTATQVEAIIMHKYFAMFLQPEAYADWRRTGFPALTPLQGSTIPTRFLYGNGEKNTNPNTPSGKTIYQTVFWDN